MKQLQEYENKINKLKSKLKKLQDPILSEIKKIENKKRKHIVDKKLYITDLSKFEEDDIESITAIDSNGEDVYIPDDEILEVRSGKLYASSFDNGVVQFNEETKKYIYSCFWNEKELNIVGFIDIKVRQL